MNEQEGAEAIRDLASWLSYAEGNAEQRLYSFLMAASLLLLGCATIVASDEAPNSLSALLAACGLLLAVLWVIIGNRQRKFHSKLELEVRRLLQGQSSPEKYAIKHIQDLESDPRGAGDGEMLNRVERILSTRTFMWLVPSLFVLVFLLVLVYSLNA